MACRAEWGEASGDFQRATRFAGCRVLCSGRYADYELATGSKQGVVEKRLVDMSEGLS